ncbi:uncharacterized protein LOC116345814 isoform X3 [Contarinia nasturtii]|uniref:uncharacterized protein LOC116345814 isoform X3 n=1 Tax=Contarinia nasturtii TaxID=265458 RepID=UPI0012D44CC3|nr:uncharacterized protein LOC116345814 isoform X3 [Contarinia nasturtii]
MKNFLLISILAMTVVSFLPRTTYGSTTTEVEEQPQALPLTADKKPVASCRYEKSQWTECNPETNVRTRTLSLKKGDEGCIPTRTIQKKCKKACRYDKGEWSKCVNGSMSRKDNVRSGSDASCKPTREITKNCNKDKKQKKQDKNGRKGHA